ncbi:MAG TPA: glutaredoxin family protein [candidate division Zixibacteria bacterium]|jgi:glutaredoxin|nr:glutaredoxin family protein [candidate division Zixibacteria bacterium]
MAKATSVKGGKEGRRVLLYTLSTCVWCRKTKKLLQGLGVPYEYIDVDLLRGAEEEAVMDEVRRHNPACTFPTMVIDGAEVIAGFKEAEIRKALG